MQNILIEGLHRHLKDLTASLEGPLPSAYSRHRDARPRTSQSPQRDKPITRQELSPVPRAQASSPLSSLFRSQGVPRLALQEIHEPSRCLTPSELPLKVGETVLNKENDRLEEKVKMLEEQNIHLQSQMKQISMSLEESMRHQEPERPTEDTFMIRRILRVTMALERQAGGATSRFSSLRQSICPSAREPASLDQVVRRLERAADRVSMAEVSKQQLREELLKVAQMRHESQRLQREVMESSQWDIEREKFNEKIKKLEGELSVHKEREFNSETHMFALSCENQRLTQRLHREETAHAQNMKEAALALEESRLSASMMHQQTNRDDMTRKRVEIENESKFIQQERAQLKQEQAQQEAAKQIREQKEKQQQMELNKLKLELEAMREKLQKKQRGLQQQKKAFQTEKLELMETKDKIEKEQAGAMARMELEGQVTIVQKVEEQVKQEMEKAEKEKQAEIGLLKEMAKERVEEMKKVHDRVMGELELKLQKLQQEKDVEIQKARLEAKQEEEQARLAHSQQIQNLHESELKHLALSQKLQTKKFSDEIGALRSLLEQLAARHLEPRRSAQEFYAADLEQARSNLSHLERSLGVKARSVEKVVEEETESEKDNEEQPSPPQLQSRKNNLKRMVAPPPRIEDPEPPSLENYNPLLSSKSQVDFAPSSPIRQIKSKAEAVCARCGGSEITSKCSFHPFRAKKGVSALLYTEAWHTCREQCGEGDAPCFSYDAHFYVKSGNEKAQTIGVMRGEEPRRESRAKHKKSRRASLEERESLDRGQIKEAMRSVQTRIQQLQRSSMTKSTTALK